MECNHWNFSNNRPDFIGIGMERAGTSWLFRMLAAHPDIWVPPIKELHYFDVISPELNARQRRYNRHLRARIRQKAALFWRFEDRPELYKNTAAEYLAWDARYFVGERCDRWYQSLFDRSFTKGRIGGEITPAYCNLGTEVIHRILKLNSNMKFILMIRDPAERAWSGMIFRLCHLERRPFESLSEEAMLDVLRGDHIKAHSNLASILENWNNSVPADQLFMRPMAAISKDPESLVRDLYSFLGVDERFQPPSKLLHHQINKHTRQRYEKPPAVARYLEQTYGDQAAALAAPMAHQGAAGPGASEISLLEQPDRH